MTKTLLTALFCALTCLMIVGCNDCKDVECQNGGVCQNGDCICPDGFTGTNCETPTNTNNPSDTIYVTIVGVKFSKGTVSDITDFTAKVTSNFSALNTTLQEHGHCWSKTNNTPTIESSDGQSSLGAKSAQAQFISDLINLQPGTKYWVRAYFIRNNVTYYHEQAVSFITTFNNVSPQVLTALSATEITQTSAKVGGSIIFIGQSSISAYGHCYSTTSNAPTLDNADTTNLGAASAVVPNFVSNLLLLQPASTYYVRAYATNAQGTGYGETIVFQTIPPTLATVTTLPNITDITTNTANAQGAITNLGSGTIIKYGHVWSTISNPTFEVNVGKTNLGTTIMPISFNSGLPLLIPNTTYYVRAYAENSVGISYGQEVTFTTLALSPPSVITVTNVTPITTNTATASGAVTSFGTSAVTQHGHVWSTTSNPTITSNSGITALGSIIFTSTFTSELTALIPNTTYYVRAYAENSVGISYGQEVTFTTLALSPPSVITLTKVTSITTNTATASGAVTSFGTSAVTQHGHVWSTTSNPTIDSNSGITTLGSIIVTSTFTSNLNALMTNTTYYVKAYATNSVNTSYGNQIQFTTSALTLPTLSIGSISNITTNSASVTGSSLVALGNSAVTQYGHVWSTNPNPVFPTDAYHVAGTNPSAPVSSFSSPMTGLSPATVYYVRSFATNSAGTAYSPTYQQFNTPSPSPPTVTFEEILSITPTSVQASFTVNSTGSSPVTQYGFVINTTPNPTLANNLAVASVTGTAVAGVTYNSGFNSLTPYTTYYIRPFATGSCCPTSYGSQQSFFSCHVPNGLIAFYTFDDQAPTATDVIDDKNGILNNGANYSSDTYLGTGYSMQFDGIDDYINVPYSLSLTSRTYNVWVKSSDVNGGVLYYASNYGVEWSNAKLKNCFGGTFGNDISLPLLQGTQWKMLTYTYVPGQGEKYYIDGSLQEVNSSNCGTLSSISYGLGRGYSNSNWLSGKIDNLRIYNVGLTQAQIMELYEAGQ